MCGVIGVFNHKEHELQVQRGLEVLKSRGRDAHHTLATTNSLGTIGHALHAVTGHVEQPLRGKGLLSFNGEIYNYKELGVGSSDTEVLLLLLDNTLLDEDSILLVLDQLDGDYSFIYERDGTVICARDLVGVKPLWYSPQEGLAVASEKKALIAGGYDVVIDLNPRQIINYNTQTKKLTFWKREFYKKQKPTKEASEKEIVDRVKTLCVNAINKRIPAQHIKVGVLFSGGVDSLVVAKTLKELGVEIMCYTAHVHTPRGEPAHDLLAAQGAAQKYGLPLTVIAVDQERIPTLARAVVEEIEEAHAVKVAVGMPFYVCSQAAAQDGCKVIFSGLGAEELFAGYKRHKDSSDVNDECLQGLLWMYDRDLYRDDVLTMNQGVELRVPFLDRELIAYSLTIHSTLKLKDGVEKYVLRKAAQLMGLDEKDAFRPKKAAQYGSKFDWALEKVARAHGQSRSEYLRQFTRGANRKLGVLCSGGKDSWFAAHIMKKLNYELSCLLVMKSKNLDSYLFHTPAIELVELQSDASSIPLLEQETQGVQEEELEDLRRLLERAKKEYGIEGVVSGALYSHYQRERIERVCDELGIKSYSPLWHIGQSSEVQEILHNDFSVMITAVAGEGMSEEWVGRMLEKNAYEELVELEKRIGFNVAGEGGEYESLVLDCPLFTKKLCLDYEKNMESSCVGRVDVKKAWLEEREKIE